MPTGLNELLNTQASALHLREARQELLASNIANADTPNYKARDINFSQALQQATQSKGGSGVTGGQLAMSTTAVGHLAGKHAAGAGAAVQFRNDQQGGIDGNNVDADKERVEFADNGVRYEASVTLITAQIHGMLAVVQN